MGCDRQLNQDLCMGFPEKQTRRHFVKTVSFGTAAATIMGRPWRATLLAEIQPTPDPTFGLLRIKLSDYPPLMQEFGSVRLGVTPLEDPFTPSGLFYPIVINRGFGTQFYALNSACRHAGCVVPPYDESEGLIRCGCHGSTYSIDGSVVGGPSVSSLFTYPVSFDGNDTLTIEVPSLGYKVTASAIQGGDAPRIKLDFPSLAFVEYELRFGSSLRDEWTLVPFSLTSDGPADQFSLIGDDLPATMFADRTTPTGFFSVSIKILDLTNG